MAPPATPRNRFPSPDDVPRPRTDPPRGSTVTAVGQLPQIMTPGPLTTRRHATQFQTPVIARSATRGFSPDPDFFTPLTKKGKSGKITAGSTGGGDSTGKRRRRSFDLDEIDEALMVSGKPKVLGPSSGGWKYPAEYFMGTPVPRKTQITRATPTPSSVRRPGFRQSSAVISSPPEDLNLSYGDTQEDVQDDSDGEGSRKEKKDEAVVLPQRKRQKSAGVFDDIESIASSLPTGDEVWDDDNNNYDQGSTKKENAAPPSRTNVKSGPRTPPKNHILNSFTPMGSLPRGGPPQPPPRGEGWIPVPNQPQLKLPPVKSPTAAKLNKAICAMAWSPSHRKRRNANNKYLTGGLAATVLGWAYDAQDSVLRSNMVIEQQQQQQQQSFSFGGLPPQRIVLEVETAWKEENYAAVTGVGGRVEGDDDAQEGGGRLILIGDENSALRKDLRQGSRVEVRAPMWEVSVDGKPWTVGINWRLLPT